MRRHRKAGADSQTVISLNTGITWNANARENLPLLPHAHGALTSTKLQNLMCYSHSTAVLARIQEQFCWKNLPNGSKMWMKRRSTEIRTLLRKLELQHIFAEQQQNTLHRYLLEANERKPICCTLNSLIKYWNTILIPEHNIACSRLSF
jgi:hypothetical protein